MYIIRHMHFIVKGQSETMTNKEAIENLKEFIDHFQTQILESIADYL